MLCKRISVFPKKLYLLIAIAILGAVIAYLSRFDTHLPIRGLFRSIGYGDASLVEHFLAGFAVPAFIVGLVLLVMPFVAKPRFLKCPIRILAIVKLRRCLLTRSRPVYINHWTAVISLMYAIISLKWETHQAESHGFFQFDQFGMDVAGVVSFSVIMWAVLEKDRQRAKKRRSFSLV